MNRWKYQYSFISGILFVLSFFSKELIINSNVDNAISVIIPYSLMVLYIIGLLLGFIKYSVLNEKTNLFWSTISTVIFYSLRIIIELLSMLSIISENNSFIGISNYSLAIGLLIWGLVLVFQRKIYGKTTLLQGLISILFSFSMILPKNSMILILQPIIFLSLFISITYLINKNDQKLNKTKKRIKPKLLRNDLL